MSTLTGSESIDTNATILESSGATIRYAIPKGNNYIHLYLFLFTACSKLLQHVHFPIPRRPAQSLTYPDVPTILSLIKELATYEKAASSVLMTEASLLKTLSFPEPSSTSTSAPTFTPGYAKTLLLAAPDGTTCAMAVFYYSYSTWTGPGIYLEDLFVQPDYRGKGYGKLLLKQLARETKLVGGHRLEWSCLDWNTSSLEFYESEAVGAKRKNEWVGLRVEGKALDRLAGEK